MIIRISKLVIKGELQSEYGINNYLPNGIYIKNGKIFDEIIKIIR